MNNIKQLIKSLILCHLLRSYLILSIPLEFSHSKSIIDIIFSDYISQEIISGNLTSTISDPLHQFLIAPHSFWNAPNKKKAFLNVIGLHSIGKSSFLTVLQQIGPIFWNFRITILIDLSKTFLTPLIKFLIRMLNCKSLANISWNLKSNPELPLHWKIYFYQEQII